MKKTAKVLSLVLCVSMLLCIMPITSFAQEKTAQSVYWSYDNSTDTLTISDTPANGRQEFTVDAQRWADVYTMPWNIEGKWYSNVKTVVIDGSPRPFSTSEWFANDHNLTQIVNLKNLDTSCTEDMSSMFNSCTKLTEIDLSNFDTSKVTSFFAMFTACIKVEELDLSSFDTSSGKYFSSMFNDCAKLTKLDVSSFDVENAEIIDDMFGMCMALEEINLFAKPKKIRSVQNLFDGCENLTTITAPCDGDWAGVFARSCFNSCNCLVGENGSAYVDYTSYGDFFHFDGGSENPGYLTKAHTPGEAVKENVTAATCTKGGSYDEVEYCTVCSDEISRKTVEVEAKGHTDGDNDGKCDNCGEFVKEPCKLCGRIHDDSNFFGLAVSVVHKIIYVSAPYVIKAFTGLADWIISLFA